MAEIPPEIGFLVIVVFFVFAVWFLRERSIKEGWNNKWHEVWNPETKQWERRRRNVRATTV